MGIPTAIVLVPACPPQPGGRLLDSNYGRGEGGRDPTKVAQYEVLGKVAKRRVRRLWSHAAPRTYAAIDRPVPPSSRRLFAGAP